MIQDREKLLKEIIALTNAEQNLDTTVTKLEDYIAEEKAKVAKLIFDEYSVDIELGTSPITLASILARVKDGIDGLISLI